MGRAAEPRDGVAVSLVASWGAWVGTIVLTFAIHEGIALATVGVSGTLTAWTRKTTLNQPILIFVLGILVGGAALHFWGHGDCG
jgi:hypothetical protein